MISCVVTLAGTDNHAAKARSVTASNDEFGRQAKSKSSATAPVELSVLQALVSSQAQIALQRITDLYVPVVAQV